MRTLFIGGYGHHYLVPAALDGRLEAVGWASDGVDAEASRRRCARRLGSAGGRGAAPFFDDCLQAFDRLEPEVVNIGGVHGRQGPIVAEAVRRGIKVVADKPIAANRGDLEAVERAVAEASGRGEPAVVLTEYDLRSRPAFRAAREAVQRGMVGRPVLVTTQKSYRFGASRPAFYRDRADYGGTLLWIASHGVDLAWYAAGRPFAWVTGVQGNLAKPEYGDFEDHVALCYALADGGAAVVHADFLRPASAPTHGDDRLRLVGAEGQVEVRDGRCQFIANAEEPRDITDLGGAVNVTDELVEAIKGERSVYCTSCSMYMARVLLGSRDAADTGARVELPDGPADCR